MVKLFQISLTRALLLKSIFSRMIRRVRARKVQKSGESNSTLLLAKQESFHSEFGHLLPFSLQNLCLSEVINDLDSYPVDLLASMPLWFRKKLLNNLPILDLNHLDKTIVTKDVKTDKIWMDRFYSLVVCKSPSYKTRGQLTYHLTCISGRSRSLGRQSFKEVRKNLLTSAKEFFLFEMAAFMLTTRSQGCFNNGQIDKTVLISIDGKQLFKNLHLQSCTRVSSEQIDAVLKRQKTALKLVETRTEIIRNYEVLPYAKTDVSMIPHRYMQHFECSDPTARMLSLLANECCVRPPTANIYIDAMSPKILAQLHAERDVRESNVIPSPDQMTCSPSVHQIFSTVRALKFTGGEPLYSTRKNIGAIISIVEGIKAKESDCQLECLVCEFYDLYQDLISPITSLFCLPNFSKLTVKLDRMNPANFIKLIQAFLTTPCVHNQILNIAITISQSFGTYKCKTSILPNILKEEDLGKLHISEALIPRCINEHKTVRFLEEKIASARPLTTRTHYCGILHIISQFSKVPFNEIHIDNDLQLCTLHPNLRVMKVELKLDDAEELLEHSTRNDLSALFSTPFLHEFSICGNWGHSEETKSGLIDGLHRLGRAQSPMSLKKICLVDTSQGYSEGEYMELWDAIFSLPDLNQLEITLGRKLMDISNEGLIVKMIFQSWKNSSVRTCLKHVSFEEDIEINTLNSSLISYFTQSHLFVSIESLKCTWKI